MNRHAFSAGLLGLFLFCLTVTSAVSETIILDAEDQFGYARTLYEQGEFPGAAAEFSRFIHFFPEAPQQAAAHYARALAFYMDEQYEKAGKSFGRFRHRFDSSALALAAGMMEAMCHNRLGDPAGGVVLLSNLQVEFKGDAEAQHLLLTRLAWTRLAMGDLPRAEAAFKASAGDVVRSCGVQGILNSLDQFKALPEKSPTLAGGFALIPGGGYLYLGRYQDATVAFLLNVALGLAAAESFDDGNNALGALISFVGFGFYSGSIHGSYTGALKANRQSRESLWKEMLHWGDELEKNQSKSCLGLTLTIPY
ncbi:hypothetical protein [Desulfoluna sp.]|uniref:tetratricopeptide repeat protein n=1 Tax=Desulfoluna sp. TaxID=2045199 RepID=UPI002634402C|nr:hypothetical protein [Desulfoluna sp.]